MYEVNNNSTVHGLKTPHGAKTPHKFPIANKVSLVNTMSDLVSQLYPTGRAFYIIKNGIKELLHSAFNRSFIRLVNDSQDTLNSIFPDNDNFTIDDCLLWEYRFGLITNTSLNITDRKNAILRKMSRGRNVPARQHKKYIEYQLQIAGFDVYVHENSFFEGGIWVYKTPEQITAGGTNIVQHGNGFQHGIGAEHGSSGSQLIANSFKPNESYSVANENLWATFFIGGQVLGDMANIHPKREQEFRELVLKLKPAHLVAFTFINFTDYVTQRIHNDIYNDIYN